MPVEEKKQKKANESQFFRAGLAGAQTEGVQRYGAAVKEHIVAYTGMDEERGVELAKGLKDIAQSKVNPADRARNIKQQAGFSAEVKTTARENAEKIISGNRSSKVTRTDDMTKQPDGKGHTVGGKNEQLYDIAAVDKNGIYIESSGRQLKYVGGDAKSCCQKLLSRKFDKYRDADVPVEIPSDFYDTVKTMLENKQQELQQQIERAEQNGNLSLARKKSEQLKRVKKTSQNLRKGKLSNAEAIEARLHPVLSTAKDVANISHQAGKEAAQYGALIGGSVSIIQNLVAVVREEKEPEDALVSVAVDTVSSAAIGYGTGFTGAAIKGIMQNASSQTVRTLSYTNLPGTLVSLSVGAAGTLKRYYCGEITGTECFEELGEQGVGMLSSALFATIGQVAIPIPVVGAMIGGMLGYALASASYSTLLDSLKNAELAKQERERIEAACNEHIAIIRQYRQEVDLLIKEYFSVHMEIFQTSFSGIKEALLIGDVDGVISCANQIVETLGKKPLFDNQAELEKLMLDDKPFQL